MKRRFRPVEITEGYVVGQSWDFFWPARHERVNTFYAGGLHLADIAGNRSLTLDT